MFGWELGGVGVCEGGGVEQGRRSRAAGAAVCQVGQGRG